MPDAAAAEPTAAEVPQMGDNITDIKRTGAERIQAMSRLMEERSAITSDITAIRASMVSDGMNRAAINAATAYYRSEPDQRRGYDSTYSMLRDAIDQPVQAEMFEVAPPQAPPQQTAPAPEPGSPEATAEVASPAPEPAEPAPEGDGGTTGSFRVDLARQQGVESHRLGIKRDEIPGEVTQGGGAKAWQEGWDKAHEESEVAQTA